ncbi:hypothetical protein ABDK00_007190 [Niabella insulamsoli]|uniref:TonB-dependent receptor n=1 Tax=Niabella insulamsoli TaxID=3144874 RepID=UPI0031FDD502
MGRIFYVFLLSLSLLLLHLKSNSQITIFGRITDTLGNAIKGANVQTKKNKTAAITAFAFSDSFGDYSLTVSSIDSLDLILVTCVGFESNTKRISAEKKRYNFILIPKPFILPNVVVKGQDILTKHGDTLDYNPKIFTRSQDRTIGDVLKNLPGVEIDATGGISYNGKPINKFYIDGDDLLGPKYGIASNTIPIDVVEKIQIFENHEPVKMFRGKIISDNAAINIKLNNTAKLKLFGSGNASIGTPVKNATDARINTLLFNSKLKMINSYLYNNVGRSIRDEVTDQKITTLADKQNANSINRLLSFTSLPPPLLQQRDYLNNNSHLLTINNLVPINTDKSIKFNFYLLADKNYIDNKQLSIFYIPNDTVTQFENQKAKLNNPSYFFSTDYLYNGSHEYLKNQFSIHRLSSKNISDIVTENDSLNQLLGQAEYKVTDNFSLKKEINKNLILDIKANGSYSSIKETLDIMPGTRAFFTANNALYDLERQNTNLDNINLNFSAATFKKYRAVLLGLRLSYWGDLSKYSTHAQTSVNKELKNLNDFSNDLQWLNNSIKTTPFLEYNTKKLKISAGADIITRIISYKNLNYVDTAFSRLSLHPTFKATLETGKYTSFIGTWRRETSFSAPENFLEGFVLTNYRNVVNSLQNLQYTDINTLSVLTRYRNPLKISFITLGFIYSKNVSPSIAHQIFQNGSNTVTQTPFKNITNRTMVLTSYSKYLIPFKTTIKANYSSTFLQYFQLQNLQTSQLKGSSQNLNLSIVGKPKWYFNFELNSSIYASKVKNITLEKQVGDILYLWSLGFNPTISFNEHIYLQVWFNHLTQKDGSNKNRNSKFDSKLNYSIKKAKTDVGIQAYNILNQKRYIQSNYNGLQFSTYDYWIRPFTFMAYFTFRF